MSSATASEPILTSLRRWRHVAGALPRLTASAVGRGLLPAGPAAVSTCWREGFSELHWKVLGDALVRFCQHSGPVLTKLGQILATRGDLLPRAMCARLEALYSRQPAMPPARVRRILRRAYGAELPFARFSWKPIAVGSVGQVHRARLPDGSRAVVKILRPGVRAAVRRDVASARALIELLCRARRQEATRSLAFQVVEDLGRAFELECDLESEADAVEAFRARCARNPRVYVPVCHRALCSREVLVLEELRGKPLASLKGKDADAKAAKRAASLALGEILAQIFDDGHFHADPHGGNLLLLPDGRLGLIDLGLTGALTRRDRRNINRAARAFLARDADAVIRILLEFGAAPPEFDLASFKRDVWEAFEEKKQRVVAQVTGGVAGDAPPNGLEELVNELFEVSRRHGIRLPPSTTLLIKTVVTIEGVARSLDPQINVLVAAAPVMLRSLTPRWARWPWHRR